MISLIVMPVLARHEHVPVQYLSKCSDIFLFHFTIVDSTVLFCFNVMRIYLERTFANAHGRMFVCNLVFKNGQNLLGYFSCLHEFSPEHCLFVIINNCKSKLNL